MTYQHATDTIVLTRVSTWQPMKPVEEMFSSSSSKGGVPQWPKPEQRFQRWMSVNTMVWEGLHNPTSSSSIVTSEHQRKWDHQLPSSFLMFSFSKIKKADVLCQNYYFIYIIGKNLPLSFIYLFFFTCTLYFILSINKSRYLTSTGHFCVCSH